MASPRSAVQERLREMDSESKKVGQTKFFARNSARRASIVEKIRLFNMQREREALSSKIKELEAAKRKADPSLHKIFDTEIANISSRKKELEKALP